MRVQEKKKNSTCNKKKLEKQMGYKRETTSNEVGMAPNGRGRCVRKGCCQRWKLAGKGIVMCQRTVTRKCCLARVLLDCSRRHDHHRVDRWMAMLMVGSTAGVVVGAVTVAGKRNFGK